MIGGVGLAVRPSRMKEARRALAVLSPKQFSTLAAVADTLCPGGDGFPSAWEVLVPEKVDALLAAKAPADADEFALVLDLVESALVNAVLEQSPQTFSQSSDPRRARTLQSMAHSSLIERQSMFVALRGLCCASYWSDPKVYVHTGYRGPPNFGNVGVANPIVARTPEPPETP